MIWEVKMPRIDEDMEEGTVTRWLKREGESVRKGDSILEIETQKVNFTVEAPGDGQLRIILAEEGQLIPIGGLMAIIAGSEDDLGAYHKILQEKKKTVSSPSGVVFPTPKVFSANQERILASPIARKMALDMGLDLSKIRGTGPEGRITKEDVLNFQAAPKESPAETRRRVRQVLPLSGMRKTIADRLSESWHNSPRAEHYMTADVTALMRMREKHGEAWEKKYGIQPSINDAVIAAAAMALREFPIVNSALCNGQIELYEDINISVAVSLEKGLITPVLRKADTRDIFNIARETRRLTELVRKGVHTRETLAGSTFTVTNLGMFDVEFFVPVINPPESAILSVGKVEKNPVVIHDAIVIRSVMKLCLAFDHRVMDGAAAAQFLRAVKNGLENPQPLFPEGSGS